MIGFCSGVKKVEVRSVDTTVDGLTLASRDYLTSNADKHDGVQERCAEWKIFGVPVSRLRREAVQRFLLVHCKQADKDGGDDNHSSERGAS